MSYWNNNIEDNNRLLEYKNSNMGLLPGYFTSTELKLLDEWLEEDRILLLTEAETIDPHWADNYLANLPSSIWNWAKGLVTGTTAFSQKPITSSTTGDAMDKVTTAGIGKGTRGLAGIIKSWFGGNEFKDGKDTGKLATEGFKGMANKLSDFMRNNSNVTTATLAGAGLLGIYYLYRKWKNNKNKKPDAATIQHAVELDQRSPNQIPPQERNRPAEV